MFSKIKSVNSKRSSFAYTSSRLFNQILWLQWNRIFRTGVETTSSVMLVHKSTIRRMSELKSTYFVIGLPLNSWNGIHRLQFSEKRKKVYYIKCLVRAIYGVVSFYTEVIILKRRIQKMLTPLMVCWIVNKVLHFSLNAFLYVRIKHRTHSYFAFNEGKKYTSINYTMDFFKKGNNNLALFIYNLENCLFLEQHTHTLGGGVRLNLLWRISSPPLQNFLPNTHILLQRICFLKGFNFDWSLW